MKGFIIAAIMAGSLQYAEAKEIVFTTSNLCVIDSAINKATMRKTKVCLVDKMFKRRGKKYPIYLYIDSPGGGVYTGVKFIEFAKSVRNLHTVTSYAASMAAAIVQQLPGKRYVMDSGLFMFHRAYGSFSGQMETGELESKIALWKRVVKQSESRQAKRIGITLREFKLRLINEWWLYGEDSVYANVADEVVDVRCSMKLSKQTYKVRRFGLLRTYTVKYSRCPLIN